MHERHFGLDFCRTLAIGLVLVSHGRLFLEPAIPALQVLRVGGFLGVELFFVLSGFLIGSMLYRDMAVAGQTNLRTFWLRRWFRTLPAYYFYLTLNVVAGASGHAAGLRLADLPAYLTFTQNLLWPHPPFFGEAWSLSVEEVFYLLLPAAALGLMALTGSRKRAFLVAVVGIGAASFAARLFVVLVFDPTFDEGVRKIVLLRLDALMIGVLLAVACAERPSLSLLGSRPACWIALVAAAAAVVAWLLSPIDQLDASFAARTLLFTATSLLGALLIVLCLGWRHQRGMFASAVRQLALWSYSAYLANLLVRQLLTPWIDRSNIVSGGFGFVVFVVFTLALAALTYRLIEVPFLALRDRIAPVNGGSAAAAGRP